MGMGERESYLDRISSACSSPPSPYRTTPWYNSSLFSRTIVLKETATSPSAIAMLLRMFGSLDVSKMGKSRGWFASQICELTQTNLLNESVATARSVAFCPKTFG
jgi:hypothetical protein